MNYTVPPRISKWCQKAPAGQKIGERSGEQRCADDVQQPCHDPHLLYWFLPSLFLLILLYIFRPNVFEKDGISWAEYVAVILFLFMPVSYTGNAMNAYFYQVAPDYFIFPGSSYILLLLISAMTWIIWKKAVIRSGDHSQAPFTSWASMSYFISHQSDLIFLIFIEQGTLYT